MVNRSQEDIISRRNIGEARAAELEFFDAHSEYSSVPAHCGLHNLAKALNHILVEHIRALLPSLKTSIEEMLDKRFHELKLYGDPLNGQSAGTRYCGIHLTPGQAVMLHYMERPSSGGCSHVQLVV